MSASNAFEQGLAKLIFQNDASDAIIAAIGSGLREALTAGSLYLSLHTGDPGEGGAQNTSESAFTSYARVAVARSAGGWTVSGTAPTQASNAAVVSFPTCTGGTSTITHVAIGTASSGAGNLIASLALTAPLAVSNGITPQFAIGALAFTAD